MTLEEIQARLSDMDCALTEKGYITPDCQLDIKANGGADIWIKTGRDGDLSGKLECVRASTLADVFDAADDLIDSYEPVENYRKKEAVKGFGRAVDGLRAAGFDARFTDPLSEQLQALTENLLTYDGASRSGLDQ